MAQPDGSIIIDTGIKTDGIKKGVQDITKDLERLKRIQKEFIDLGEDTSSSIYREREKDIQRLQASLEKLKNTQKDEALSEIEKEEKRLEELANRAVERAKQTENSVPVEQKYGRPLTSPGYDQDAIKFVEDYYNKTEKVVSEEQKLDQIRVNSIATNDQIIEKVERLRQLEQEIADLKAAGITEGYADYDNRIIESEQLKQDIRDYRDSLSEVPERFSRMRAAAQKAFNAIKAGFIAVGNTGKKALVGTLNLWKKSLLSTMGLVKKLFSSIIGGSKKSNASLSGGFKTLLRYGFGIRSLYALFNKIRSGITEGFKNLMGYSDSFANSVQSVKNSMSTLGNQIAAAFSPIVQMVIPWLNSLISALSNAMTYVAQFIAALTGKSTFTKATQIQDKYNKSLGGTAKAADKARGALAKFDDLDVLQKQEDASGGGGAAVTDPSDMFEEAKVSDKWKNIADWFRQMWENSDFYELGKLLGEKLKEALESIPWDEIKETARKIGTSLATLINGFIEVDGLGFTIGNTLAEAFNTGFEILNAFIHELHWDSIGIFIADTINGFFTGIDWELIYDTFITGAKGLGDAINSFADELDWEAISESVSNFINTFVDTIYTFITTVNWAELGEKVGKTISDAWAGIDWTKVGETVGEHFKAFFNFILNVIENIDWYAVGESVREFLCGIDWAGVAASFFEFVGDAFGGFASFLVGLFGESFITGGTMSEESLNQSAEELWNGFIEGIKNAFSGIGEFVKTNIFEPFMEGLRNAFGIHSPSTAMAEIGGYLIEGLKNGLLNGLESLKETIGSVASNVVEKFRDILGIHSPSTVMEENGIYMVDGLKNGIESTIDSVYALFNPDTWTEIGTQMFNSLMLTVEMFREMWTETFTLWQEENTELYFGYDIWYEQWLNMLTAYNDVNSEFMSEWQSNITSWWNTMVMPYFTILQWKTFGENMRNGIMQGFKAIVNNIAGVLNQVIQLFNSAYKQLQDSMNSLIDDYNSKAAVMGTSTLSHVNYNAMKSINVPALASGAVIRGGNPFLAILGDQPRSQTNIETPLSTMVDAFKQAMSEMSGVGGDRVPVNININYDNETFMRIVIPDLLSELGRQGYDVEVLGAT